MNGLMRLLLACILMLGMCCPARAEKVDRHIFGSWRIVSVADYAGIGADTDEEDTKRLIGATLTISAKRISFDKETCRNPSYKTVRKTLDEAFWIGFQLQDTRQLRLPEPVKEIQAHCANPTGITVLYVRNHREIVFVWSGIFFNAVKHGD
jgi:hypothetical protein